MVLQVQQKIVLECFGAKFIRNRWWEGSMKSSEEYEYILLSMDTCVLYLNVHVLKGNILVLSVRKLSWKSQSPLKWINVTMYFYTDNWQYTSVSTNMRTKCSGLFLLQRSIRIQLMKGGDCKPLPSHSCLAIIVQRVCDPGLSLRGMYITVTVILYFGPGVP